MAADESWISQRSDSAVDTRRARDDPGLTVMYEDQSREVRRGELGPVLEEFCEPFPGYYLYYPQRRHTSPALRALIDHLRAARTRPGRRRRT